ncbi:hypothetical protein CN395_15310 [Priestia megaterium]|uniref:lipopolysaccharide biosynthesis protein n=1 Tax=Priestia megaterium TaxID=1404 RepID=UPI000BF95BB2|nr:polysaccharide biosynthesis C-terminal domain-containing protein [Priestia megaterium]PEU60002.1 hypothetical protein CN395_15310 [Priestia megaterium]
MKREKRLLINTIILSFGSVFPKSVTFLILPILTAALTKAEYGTYDLVLTSTSFIVPIFSLLIEQAVFRVLLDAKTEIERKKIITNSLVYILACSFLLFIVTSLIVQQLKIEFCISISIYMVLNLYYRYTLQICRGLGFLKKYSLSSIINSFLNLFLILLFIKWIDYGLYGLLIALNVSILVATLYSIFSISLTKYFSKTLYDWNYIKKLLIYSAPLLPNTLSWWVVSVSDRWIITIFLGVEMTAIYAIANKIPSMFNLVYNNFNLAWQESASTTVSDDDMADYYTNIFNHMFNFLVGILLILITTSPILFKVFVDESYYLAYYQMPVLFLAMFFNSFAAYYGGIYVALKKTKNIGLSSLIAALLNIVMNLLFINKIGLYAASFSTLLAYFTLTMYRAIDLQQLIKIRYSYTKILAVVLFLGIVSWMNHANIYYLNIVTFIVSIVVAITLNKSLLNRVFKNVLKKYFKKSNIY